MMFNTNAAYSQLGVIRNQVVYNGMPRYRINREVLRTKIMPSGEPVAVIETPTATVAVDENGEIVAAEKPVNWGPLALAAAVTFFALG
jgi:hypothetical protein